MNKIPVETIAVLFLHVALSPLSFGDENKFYENTSSRYFVYALYNCDLTSDQDSKLHIARRISKQMFIYWYESRHLGLKKSDKVDSAIVHAYAAYKRGVIKGDFFIAVLEDPLDCISKNYDLRVLLKGKRWRHWKIENIDEYKTLLVEYFKFLEERMAQIEKVDLHKMLDMYETD